MRREIMNILWGEWDESSSWTWLWLPDRKWGLLYELPCALCYRKRRGIQWLLRGVHMEEYRWCRNEFSPSSGGAVIQCGGIYQSCERQSNVAACRRWYLSALCRWRLWQCSGTMGDVHASSDTGREHSYIPCQCGCCARLLSQRYADCSSDRGGGGCYILSGWGGIWRIGTTHRAYGKTCSLCCK